MTNRVAQSEFPKEFGASTREFAPIDFRNRFPALDGLRALAILAVFFEHYGGGSHGGKLMMLVNRVRLYGWVGVDLFFVLSGFLITGILYDTLGDSHYFKRFFARRSLRIFPIYYLVFAVLFALTPFLLYQWRPGHLLFLVYLGNFLGNYDFSYYDIASRRFASATVEIGHFWSLCVEEQFYLLWPPLVYAVRRRRSLLVAAALLSLSAVALRMGLYLYGGAELSERWSVRTLPFRVDSLLAGAMLALLLRGSRSDAVQRSCKWAFLVGSAGAIGIFSLSGSLRDLLYSGFAFSFTALASAGLIGCTLRAGSTAYKVFDWKPLRTLGKYSYGFYIYHLLFAKLWIALLVLLGTRLHSLAAAGAIALPLNFVTTFLVAKVSYDFYEKRFLRYKVHFEYDTELSAHRHAFEAR